MHEILRSSTGRGRRGEVLAFSAWEMDGLREPGAELQAAHLQQDSLPR